MTKIICPKCGISITLKEIRESRFCKHCGKYITSQAMKSQETVLIQKKSLPSENSGESTTKIEETYEHIKRIVPNHSLIDSLDVVKNVEEYRNFWKPKKVKVILLAESHVYTLREENEIKLDPIILYRVMGSQSMSYPPNFVRFVYCLGYGENDLLERRLESNQGTWQFWKIFSRCIGKDETKVSKKNHYLERRLRSKVEVLREMQKRGIWLLDASIVGLYRSGIKKYPKALSRIIQTSWRNYVEKIVLASEPKHVIVIGKAVEKAIRFTPPKFIYTVIEAPQTHLPREKQQANYRKYKEICKEHI